MGGRALLDRLSSTTLSEVTIAGGAGWLLPAPLDVAPYATISANATCGERGTEEFCRETPGKRGIACDVCEGLEGPASRRHPPHLAIDGDPTTWWQSPSLAAGEEYKHVELIATLPDVRILLLSICNLVQCVWVEYTLFYVYKYENCALYSNTTNLSKPQKS
ncbi:unnamed protein product [Leptosia nina]|uniref:Laminin N-terminal domain-containing protein n=1 Tax=Leptosia nina TaxID=320188 RepID=A0AAV1JKW5_9NEOP